MRCYKSFDELYIDDEIKSLIDSDDVIHIKLQKENYDGKPRIKKDILFLLGILFAAGKKIQVDNFNEIDLSGDKAFDNLVLYWHKNKLAPQISFKSIKSNGFVISSISKLNIKQKLEIENHVNRLKRLGYNMFHPCINLIPFSSNGYEVCNDIANAIGRSGTIFLYYSKDSSISMFELGVAYYCNYLDPAREFVFLNKDQVSLGYDDFADRVVARLIEDQGRKDCFKSNRAGFRSRHLQ